MEGLQVLVTDNGNFLVSWNGLFGYFNTAGELLDSRYKVNEDTWEWAIYVMNFSDEEFEESFFDLDALLERENEELEEELISEKIAELNSSNKKPTLADLIKS